MQVKMHLVCNDGKLIVIQLRKYGRVVKACSSRAVLLTFLFSVLLLSPPPSVYLL